MGGLYHAPISGWSKPYAWYWQLGGPQDLLEEDARDMEMIKPRQSNSKKRRPKPKVSRIKKKEDDVKTEISDVDMVQNGVKGM